MLSIDNWIFKDNIDFQMIQIYIISYSLLVFDCLITRNAMNEICDMMREDMRMLLTGYLNGIDKDINYMIATNHMIRL